LVVVYLQYSHTVHGAIPIVQFVPNSSTTYSSGTVYGPGVSAFYSGTSQTYSTSSVVTSIPYSVPRFDYGATYWVKIKPPILRVRVVDVPSEKSQELGRSAGALVDLVMFDSPARAANIIRGDIIIRLDETQVTGAQQFIGALQRYAGQQVPIELIRDGRVMTVDVSLRSR
jgi:S1-C subfamily serine protease